MKKSDPSVDRIDLFSLSRERLAADLQATLEALLPPLTADIEAAAANAQVSAADQRQLYAAAATLRIELQSRAGGARMAFNDRALRCLEWASAVRSPEQEPPLIDDTELDVQVVAGAIAEEVRRIVPVVCVGFGRRVETLTRRQWASDDLQPLGPRTLGIAAGVALKSLVTSPAARQEIVGLAVARLADPLARLIEHRNQELKEEGVLPDWSPQPERETPRAGGVATGTAEAAAEGGAPEPTDASPAAAGPSIQAALASPPVDPTSTNGASDAAAMTALPKPGDTRNDAAPVSPDRAVAMSELAAEVARKLDRSPLTEADALRLRVLPTLQPVVEIERDAVAFAHSIGAVPYSRESRREFFGNVRRRLLAASANAAQVATVELVGAMFDYVVDDRRLPEPAKPLFWRLQQPAVALALLDPGYLSNEPRSLRRLIENFGAIAVAYADEFVKGGDLHRRLETVVRAVEIVASALQTRSAVISQQVDREYGRAIKNVTLLVERVINERSSLEAMPVRQNRRDYRNRPNKQRELEVSEKLRNLLEARIGNYQIPDSARDFILGVWMRHLRTAALRDGEDSTEFRLALEVVDDLLWSLDSSRGRQSRRALAKRIPPLIRLLTSGLKEIGAKEDEHKAFFDELFLVHLRKMRRDAGSPEDSGFGELSPLTSLPTLRDEIPADPPAGAPQPSAAAPNGSAPAAVRTIAATSTGTAPAAAAPSAVAQAPLAQAPVTQAPVTQAPVTQAPVVPGPVVPGPVVPGPVVPGPVVSAPPVPVSPAAGVVPAAPPQPQVPSFVPADAGATGAARPAAASAVQIPDYLRATPSTSPTKPRLLRPQTDAAQASAAVLRQPTLDVRPAGAARASGGSIARAVSSATTASPAPAAASAPAVSSAPAASSAPAVAPPARFAEPEPSSADGDERGPEQRLLEVLHTLDLSDPPVSVERLELPVDRLLETVDRGHWIALLGPDRTPTIAKVAWVNSRRTVVLLVRHPDRRALSLRMDELRQRAEQGRAYLIAR